MRVTRFEELRAWQRARELTNLVYRITKVRPFSHDFAMRNQIRRAALSVMSNVAEGFDRHRDPEFLYFLRIAKASCGEVKSQSYAAFDQMYIDDGGLQTLLKKASEAGGAICRLEESIENTEPGTRDRGQGTN
jgi:four helix bundle protein